MKNSFSGDTHSFHYNTVSQGTKERRKLKNHKWKSGYKCEAKSWNLGFIYIWTGTEINTFYSEQMLINLNCNTT